ncbi:hypothetical protein AB0P17_08600 [Streptomyces sp. NPDC088124]|uniref:hypothetical protein n=1 Tax=Streptomyces sp. NPDC088124 TaxID=3154654 RepID=UPI00341CEFB9
MPRELVMGGAVVTDVPTAIALYAPKRVAPATWTLIAPFVRACVAGSEPDSVWAAVARMSTVARFCDWALEEYLPLDREVLFTPDTVERYALTGMDALQPSSRRTHRSGLSTIGRAITRRAPWPPQKTSMSRNRLATPYTTEQVAGYLEAAGQQSTLLRTRVAFGLLAGGLGAGLMPGEHLTITGRQVTRTDDGVTVLNVTGARARTIPVLAAYTPLVSTLADRYPGEPLIGPSNDASKNRLNQLLARVEVPARLPQLTAASLRTTWLLTLLAARVPLPELLAAAGLASTGTLIGLLPHLPRLPEPDAHHTLAQALTTPPRADG